MDNMRYLLFYVLMVALTACEPARTADPTPSTDTALEAEAQAATPRIDYAARLQELDIVLPEIKPPMANYEHAVRSGNLLFLAGKGPRTAAGETITGKLGKDLTVKEGYEAARRVGVSQLAVLQQELGDLNRVKRIIKVMGMVNSTPDFTSHPAVINGFSDLMVDVFGDKGRHARAAIGMAALPSDIAVEIDVVVEITD